MVNTCHPRTQKAQGKKHMRVEASLSYITRPCFIKEEERKEGRLVECGEW